MRYNQVIQPKATANTKYENGRLSVSVELTANVFDVRSLTEEDLLKTPRENWGVFIMRNYVGFCIEAANGYGVFGDGDKVEWNDITDGVGVVVSAKNLTLKDQPYITGYGDVVRLYNKLSEEQYKKSELSVYDNYIHAVSFNRYFKISTEEKQTYDKDEQIRDIINGKTDVMESESTYTNYTEFIQTQTYVFEFSIDVPDAKQPQTYRMRFGNPSDLQKPVTAMFYHEGQKNEAYEYQYVEGSLKSIKSEKNKMLKYEMENIGHNRLRLRVGKSDLLKKTSGKLTFKLKKTTI